MHKPEKPLVKIVWQDAIYRSKIQATAEEAVTKGSLLVVTQSGYLLGEDRGKVLIGWQHDDLSGQYRHILSIPKESVVEVISLEEGKEIVLKGECKF